MKSIIAIVILLFNAALGETKQDWLSSEKTAEITRNLEELRSLAQTASALPPSESIPRLGAAVQKTSHNRIYYVGEREKVHQELKNALIAIPGHAKHYGSIILEKHALYKADIIEKTQLGRLMPYHDTAIKTFDLLKLLPSPETVEVLGEMLSEEWQDHEEREYYEPSLGASAMMCLSELPIVGKPPTSGENALAGWQNWYSQIKEGRRTFRFEGNPQEYNLQGPAREALNPNTPRATKRPSQPEATTKTEDKLQDSRSNAPKIVIIIAAILLGGSYWLYRKKSSSL